MKRDTTPAKRKTTQKAGVKTASSQTDTTSKSKSGLNSTVKYNAEDSIVTDQVNNIVYLYGKARITYEDAAIDADFI
ncbi:MAG: hypothetical protein EOP43_07580, partial [Sphingobacteriaceae bacterium]